MEVPRKFQVSLKILRDKVKLFRVHTKSHEIVNCMKLIYEFVHLPHFFLLDEKTLNWLEPHGEIRRIAKQSKINAFLWTIDKNYEA